MKIESKAKAVTWAQFKTIANKAVEKHAKAIDGFRDPFAAGSNAVLHNIKHFNDFEMYIRGNLLVALEEFIPLFQSKTEKATAQKLHDKLTKALNWEL